MEARRTWLGIFGAGALACAGSGRPTASATGGATETTVAGTSSSESAGDLTTTGAGTSTSTGTAASTGAGTTAGESTRGTDPSSTGETEETTAGAPLDGEFPGMVSVDGDDGVDRCAVDPAGDLERQLIADPDYILAYSSGLSACGVWAPSAHGDEMRHRQGIVRLHRAAANYLVVSMSVEPGFAPGIEVVRLGSRPDTLTALGSGGVTPETPPLCADHVVHYAAGPSAAIHDHAGGLQVMGRYAVVPFEDIGDAAAAAFAVADLDDPASPVWGPAVARQAGVVHDAGTAGLTRLADGQAMVMIFGDDAEEYEVFSAPADGRALTEATWTSRASGDSPAGFEAYQNLQLITRCDGALMVLGTHKTLLGDDWADLWRVELDPDTLAPTFTKVAKRNLTCRSASTGDTRYCDFQAGAGGFIGAGGRLYIYGVEHYDDAFPGDGEGVKVREFPPT